MSGRGCVGWKDGVVCGRDRGGWHQDLGVGWCVDSLPSLAQAPADSFIEKDEGCRDWGTGTGRMAGVGVMGLGRR